MYRPSATLRLRHALLGGTALLPLAMLGLSTAATAQSRPNNIVPDGRTATHLSVSGNTTTITTGTVRGSNGYNSFSQFQEAPGNTVNLMLPPKTNTLVNIVRNGTVVVGGILNSYKDGKIGGNVVFADPYGFVVGKRGVINTGALTVVTPTHDALEKVISQSGAIDDAAARSLTAGDVPLSADGAVVIKGRVNAAHDVLVKGTNVSVPAQEAALIRHRAQFESTVNTAGASTGGSIVVRHGSIQIVAAHDVAVGGTLSAGASLRAAGSVKLSAGHDVAVAPTAQIRAAGATAARSVQAGSVEIHAANNATIAGRVTTDGAARKGGAVKIAADKDVRITSTAAIKAGASVSATNAASLASVTITAGGNTSIDGAISANGAAGVKAGLISVTGAGDVSIAATASFHAAGVGAGSSGGHVLVKPAGNLDVASDALFVASAGTSGDGGMIELSAGKTATIGNIAFDLKGAAGGQNGLILFDPNDLVITDGSGTAVDHGSQGDDPVVGSSLVPSLYTNGASVELDATNSITINGTIDTRAYAGDTTTPVAGTLAAAHVASTADSGSITLSAPMITISSGAGLYADVNNVGTSFKAGDIALIATQTDSRASGQSTTSTGITIAGSVQGANVTATATSSSTSSIVDFLLGLGSDTLSASFTPTSVGELFADNTLITSLFGSDASYFGASATANVLVTSGANVHGSGNVSLLSSGTEIAATPGLSATIVNPITMAVVVAITDATVHTEIQSGATVTAGHSLTVRADNTDTLSATAMNFTLQGATFGGAVAYGQTSVDTAANVATGATVAAGGVAVGATPDKLSVVAYNKNTLGTSATTFALGSAQAGIDVAIGQYNTSAVAHLGTDVGTDSVRAGQVDVEAISDTVKNATQASANVGDNGLFGLFRALIPDALSTSAILGKISDATELSFLKSVLPTDTEVVKVAGTVSFGESNQLASASIAADTTPTSPSSYAPTVYSNGNVTVVSQLTNAGVRNDGDAAVASNAEGTAESPQASFSTALALSLGLYSNTSEAYIGNNVAVDARNVGVKATSDQPITVTWLDFDGPAQIISHINGNLGTLNDIVTSYANSNAAGEVAVAGSINLFLTSNNTTAWIGSGAHIKTSDNLTPEWTSSLAPEPGSTDAGDSVTWASGLDVEAASTAGSINVAGNFSWLVVLGSGSEGQGNGSVAAGASFNLNLTTSSTAAGVGAGAVVDSASGVTVNATTENKVVTIAPTSGKGAGIGVSGIASVVDLDDSTHASISNLAIISAATVSVTATESNSVLAITGAANSAQSTGVGVAATAMVVSTDTQAYIGNNDADVGGEDFATLADSNYPSAAAHVYTDDLSVVAATTGEVMALSVAATMVDPNKAESLSDKLSSAQQTITNLPVVGSVVTTFAGGIKSAAQTAGGAAAGTGVPAKITSAGKSAATKLGAAIDKIGTKIEKVKDLKKTASEGFDAAKNGIKGKITDTFDNPATATEYSEVSISGAGSAALGITFIGTSAYVDGATVRGLTASSSNATRVQAVNEVGQIVASGAGALNLMPDTTAGFSVAIAGAFAFDYNADTTTAAITNSHFVNADAVSVSALVEGVQAVIGLGVAVSTAEQDAVAVAGSLSIAMVFDGVDASIGNSTLSGSGVGGPAAAGDDVSVVAYQSHDIGIGGGSVTVAKEAGAGLAVTVAVIHDPTSTSGDPSSPTSDAADGASAGIVHSTLTSYDAIDIAADDVSRILSGAATILAGPAAATAGGAVVLNDVSPSTLAQITGGSTIAQSNSVSVRSESARDGTLDDLLAAVPPATTDAAVTVVSKGYDFIGLGLGLGQDNPGAAVIGLAGIVSVSENNVGASAIYDGIRQSHLAVVDGATVNVSGDTVVAAAETSTIYGGAVGVGVATDVLSGVGSIAINLIINDTQAIVGGTDSSTSTTSITTNDLAVTSTVASRIVGLSGGLSGSVGIGIGLAIASGTDEDNVSAVIQGAKVAASGSVLVEAYSTATVGNDAISLGVGGDEGVAGSIAFNIIDTTVSAKITNSSASGADVRADDNVDVLAKSADTIETISGALGIGLQAAGEGENEVANLNLSQTVASITGSTTKVDARGLGPGFAVDDGTLSTPLDLANALTSDPLGVVTFDSNPVAVKGLAVDAISTQSTYTEAAAVAFSVNVEDAVAASITLIPIINTLEGSTVAKIENASIDTRLTSGDPANVFVAAGSHTFNENAALGIAISSGGSGSGAMAFSLLDETTDAHVSGGVIGGGAAPAGTMTVQADSTNDVFNLVNGFSGAVLGGTASVIVNTFAETTKAYVDGTTVHAANLFVDAASENGSIGEAGSLAVGAVGAAGSFNVSVNQGTTLAYVGAGESGQTGPTVLDVDGTISVTATTTDDTYDFLVGGALAGGLALAGSFDANVLLTTTRAGLYDVEATQATDVTVDATESMLLIPVAGAVAVAGTPPTTPSDLVSGAGFGLGAGINLVILKSSVTSEIVASDVTASGTVDVEGTTERDILAVTASAGVAESVGMAASIGIILAGTGDPSDVTGDVNTTIAKADAASGDRFSNPGMKSDTPGYVDLSGYTKADAVSNALGDPAVDGITSRVSDSAVTAHTLQVGATSKLETTNLAAGFGAGPEAAAGAAVAYTRVDGTLVATIDSLSTINVNVLKVDAAAGDFSGSGPLSGIFQDIVYGGKAVDVKAAAGGGALGFGLGAAVAYGEVDNSITASVGSQVPNAPAGKVIVTGTGAGATAEIGAGDTSSVASHSVGAAIGTATLGAAVATSDKQSQVLAGVAVAPGDGATVSGFDTFRVDAAELGPVVSEALAGSLGLAGAGNAAVALATDESNVVALIGASTTIGTVHGLTVDAAATPYVAADALGVAISAGAAVGASVATATAAPSVTAQVGDGVAITSGGLTLSASNDVDDTPETDRLLSLDVLGPSGSGSGHSAYAFAVEGSGGLFFDAQAVVSTATTSSTVAAKIGDSVQIAGNVIVLADNTTDEYAAGVGANVGAIALGAVVTTATADSATHATIGSGGLFAAGATGAFSLKAVGTDSVYASAIAGTGGLIAGDAALALVNVGSTVGAAIGMSDAIGAGSVAIDATHTSLYEAHADTYNASVVGGSGADAESSIGSDVSVAIGDGVTMLVAGLAGSCQSAGCDPSVDISAANIFDQSGISGGSPTPNAGGGAGGVLSGTAALSKTSFTGATDITFGTGVTILSGSSPTAQAGDIHVLASTTIDAVDIVSLTTGGLIDSAGTDSQISADIENSIGVGPDTQLVSLGTVTLATYMHVLASTNAYVSTYGAAAVGSADAESDITARQTVELGSNVQLQGLGNVYVTAGSDILGGEQTLLDGRSNALGYVKGIIAIPDADAETTIANNAAVTIGSGSNIDSAQNVVIGAYYGSSELQSDAKGHGFELGFIEATDGSGHTNASKSSSVDMRGTAVAGYFHALDLTIHPDYSVTQADGVAATYSADSAFSPLAYIAAHFADPTVAAVLDTGVASGTVKAVTITSQLYAAGGTVTLNADTLTGNGTLTSYGSPTINVDNKSNAYLILSGGAYIPDTPGGQVLFTGAAGPAQAQSAGMTVDAEVGSGISSIKINNEYLASTGFGPALFVSSDITNVGGLVDIENASGSYGLTANITAQQVTVNVPNGVFAAAPNDPSGNYTVGSSPYSVWASTIIWPGGNPGAVTPNAGDAIEYLANYLYPSTSQDDLDKQVYGSAGADYPNNQSTVFYGNCLPYSSGSCGSSGYFVSDSGNSGGNAAFPALAYLLGGSLNYQTTAAGSALTYQVSAYPSTGSSPPSIQSFGGQVAIVANIIDVNATIKAGQPTNWSVDLPTSLTAAPTLTHQITGFNGATGQFIYTDTYVGGGAIGLLKAEYAAGTLTTAVNDISSALHTINAGDSVIKASYNAATDEVVLDNVNASSGGGFVLLKGAIISTSALGNISVNGGLGQVAVSNETGLDLVVNNVNTGNTLATTAITSRVKIVDTLLAANVDTTTYLYSPTSGTTKYVTANGADPVLSGPNATPVASGATDTYAPLAGERFQWVLQAQLTRDVANNGNWTFSDPNTPWRYAVSNDATGLDSKVASGNLVGADHPQGHLINDASLESVALNEQISGGIDGGSTSTHYISYHDCDGSCNFGFKENVFTTPNLSDVPAGAAYQVYVDGDGHNVYAYDFHGGVLAGHLPSNNLDSAGVWEYHFPGSAWLKLTNSVKADNSFSINFAGSGTASLSVNSNSSIALDGRITNPNGSATITASNGDITQSVAGSVLSKSLTLSSTGSIGTAAEPLAITLTGGALNAAAGASGVYVAATSDVDVGTVSAKTSSGGTTTYGDVRIAATGSILPVAGSTTNITGSDITLSSANGTIGSSAAPLVISANGMPLANGGISGGVVNAAAYGDVSLRQVPDAGQTSADLRVGLISSTTGDVAIDVPNGTAYDAAGQTSAQVLTTAQLTSIAQTLHLLGADADAAANSTVDAFVALVNADTGQYKSLLAHGSIATGGDTPTFDAETLAFYRTLANAAQIQQLRQAHQPTDRLTPLTDDQVIAYATTLAGTNGTFKLNTSDSATMAIYTALTNAYLNAGRSSSLPPLVATQADVLAYGNYLYQSYAGVFATAYGSTWKTQVNAANPAPFTAATNATLAASLKADNAWDNLTQLAAAVDVSALKPVLTEVGEGVADIVGNNVRLTTAGGVGSLAAPVTIAIADLRSGNLTQTQEAALAVATTPGSVTISGTLDGAAVTNLSISDVAPDMVLTSLSVSQTAPVFINARGTLDVNAGGAVYLQSTSSPQGSGATMTLDKVTAHGDVSLQAPDSIVAAPTSTGAQIVTSGNLTLAASAGDIGQAAKPLTIDIQGNLVSASAFKNIYLDQIGGALNIGRVAAGSMASLQASGDISAYLSGLVITAGDIALNAGGSIAGPSGTALAVNVKATGMLSGSAAGTASIGSPTISGQPAVNLQVGTFTAADGLSLTSDRGLELKGNVASANGPVSLQGASVAMDSDTSVRAGGAVTVLATTGDVTLGALVSTAAPTTPTVLVSVTALGSIAGNGDGQVNATATSGNARATFNAASIGAAGAPVTVDTPGLVDTAASSGAIVMQAKSDILVSTLSALQGAIDFSGDGAVTLGAATSGGSQTFRSHDDLTFTQLTTTGLPNDPGDVSVTSTSGAVKGGSIDAHGKIVGLGQASLVFVDLQSIGSMSLTSTAGALTLGTATSGGGQTLRSHDDLTFTQLTTTGLPNDPGDVSVTSTNGAVKGGSINAHGAVTGFGNGLAFGTVQAGGDITLTSNGDISAQQLTGLDLLFNVTGHHSVTLNGLAGASIVLGANGPVTINDMTVTTLASISAPDITLNSLRQTPGQIFPLVLDLSGFGGTIGTRAVANVVQANGLVIDELRFVDAAVTADTPNALVNHGYVPGSFVLTLPSYSVLMNNRSPRPVNGYTTQLFASGYSFELSQVGNTTVTDSYVVQYGPAAQIIDEIGGTTLNGASFVRDFERALYGTQADADIQKLIGQLTGIEPLSAEDILKLFEEIKHGPVSHVGNGPAVNMSGL